MGASTLEVFSTGTLGEKKANVKHKKKWRRWRASPRSISRPSPAPAFA